MFKFKVVFSEMSYAVLVYKFIKTHISVFRELWCVVVCTMSYAMLVYKFIKTLISVFRELWCGGGVY